MVMLLVFFYLCRNIVIFKADAPIDARGQLQSVYPE